TPATPPSTAVNTPFAASPGALSCVDTTPAVAVDPSTGGALYLSLGITFTAAESVVIPPVGLHPPPYTLPSHAVTCPSGTGRSRRPHSPSAALEAGDGRTGAAGFVKPDGWGHPLWVSREGQGQRTLNDAREPRSDPSPSITMSAVGA